MARKKSFRRYQQAQRREWLLGTLTEIARLEGRLGLLDEEAQADFYGADYLDPDQKLAKLLSAVAEAGV
jgi:hypothetical protein